MFRPRTLLAASRAAQPVTIRPTALTPQASMRLLAARLFSDEASDELKFGKVKWFDVKRGYGFITPDDGSPDVFVHQTKIYAEGFRSLFDGEPVEFKVADNGEGKLMAVDVTGPDGVYVQGAPKPVYNNDYGNYQAPRDDGY